MIVSNVSRDNNQANFDPILHISTGGKVDSAE
jgi:hypothetical protein